MPKSMTYKVTMGTTKKYRIRLDVSYDGSYFMGWQRQKEGSYTVQGVLEEKLSQILNQKISIIGSGRTDRGVHAVQQVCHFDLPYDPSHIKLKRALTSLLPRAIAVKKTFIVPEDFHALHSAKEKLYTYVIHNSKTPNPLRWKRCHWEPSHKLNLDYLNMLSQVLIGTHDFKSFQNAGTELKTTVRTIFEARWIEKKPGWIEFQIRGNGFLKQMVRNIVGTLLGLEKRKAPLSDLKAILEGKQRQLALKTAPSDGLYLTRVIYPIELDNKCRKF